MREYLQDLANQPIRDNKRASKIWLPQGKLPPKKRSESEIAESRANASAGRANEARRRQQQLTTLFEYYASTTVPVERVAEHMGISIDDARKGLSERGRQA